MEMETSKIQNNRTTKPKVFASRIKVNHELLWFKTKLYTDKYETKLMSLYKMIFFFLIKLHCSKVKSP